MSETLRFLTPAQATVIRAWWLALQPLDEDARKNVDPRFAMFSRQDRALLRRCEDADQVLLQDSFQRLAKAVLALDEGRKRPVFVDRDGGDPTPYALVAGLLAHVKTDLEDQSSFAAQLGHLDGDRPRMHALRFARLQTAASEAEFYQLARRAITLADGKADVAQLADELLAWVWEFRGNQPDKPRDRLRVRWATAYFTAANALEASKPKSIELPEGGTP